MVELDQLLESLPQEKELDESVLGQLLDCPQVQDLQFPLRPLERLDEPLEDEHTVPSELA